MTSLSLAGHAPHAELDPVTLRWHGRGLPEEEELLLEEDHRVVVPDRRGEQPLRVERTGGHRDHEARDVREQGLQALRVLRSEPDAAARDHPDHERDARRPAHHESELRGLIHDLVEGDGGEVRELQLDDRPQPSQGRADPAADEAALRQRRVSDPLGPVALVETLGGTEQAAHLADVLADHDHARIGLELEIERLAHGGDEAELPLRGRRGSRVAPVWPEHGWQEIVGARVLVGKRGLDRVLDVALHSLAEGFDPVVVELPEVSEHAVRAAGAGPLPPTPPRARGHARPEGSRAWSAASSGRSSSPGTSVRHPPGRARARVRPRPPRRAARFRPRSRRPSRNRRRGRRDPPRRAVSASRPRARTDCSRR